MTRLDPGSTRQGNKRATTFNEEAATFYEPLDFLLARAPLLPIEFYCSLKTDRLQAPAGPDASGETLLNDLVDSANSIDVIRHALAVGSLSLLDALDRTQLDASAAARRAEKLLRYLIRMSTRPTPFGLFAGVATACWGTPTDLSFASAPSRFRMRPDMEWLTRLVFALEAQPDIRSHLRIIANSTAFVQAGRVHLAQQAPRHALNDAPQESGVNLRATGIVRRALALARTPIDHSELAATLLAETPNATPELVERLITELYDQTVLLTDLRPPLTTADPAGYVLQRLADIPPARDIVMKLDDLLKRMTAWSTLPSEKAIAEYRQIMVQAKGMVEAGVETPLEVDMALPLAGTHISKLVGVEVARAADLVLRMTPATDGSPRLRAYREAFTARYESSREVPLLEMLHPAFGLGPLLTHAPPVDHVGERDQMQRSRRDQALLGMACEAVYTAT